MRKLFPVMILTFTMAVLSRSAIGERHYPSDGAVNGSLTVDGIQRTYYLYVPEKYTGRKSVPLLIVLHGGGGRGKRTEEKTTLSGFDRLADKEGFLVVYPDAVENHWNDGRNNPYSYAARQNLNDVKFISALIDHLGSKYNLDPKRVYATGVSNGGMMSFRLACELSDRIAAIAAVAASMPETLYDHCTPQHPVSVLIIHGTDDPLVPWNGGDVVAFGQHRGTVVPVPQSVEFWVKHNHCTLQKGKTWLPDKDPLDGTRVWKEMYINRDDKVRIVFYGIEGGGHTWPDGFSSLPRVTGKITHDINACRVIWDFFREVGKINK